MATPKHKPKEVGISAYREAFERDYKFIREEFYVVEHYPASEDDYGSYVSPRNVQVSGYYDTRAEAEKFIEGYDPEPGSEFVIGRRVLREYTMRSWFSS